VFHIAIQSISTGMEHRNALLSGGKWMDGHGRYSAHRAVLFHIRVDGSFAFLALSFAVDTSLGNAKKEGALLKVRL
jgi:hypothetical protein